MGEQQREILGFGELSDRRVNEKERERQSTWTQNDNWWGWISAEIFYGDDRNGFRNDEWCKNIRIYKHMCIRMFMFLMYIACVVKDKIINQLLDLIF